MSGNNLDSSLVKSESTCYPATGCFLGLGVSDLPHFWLICGRLELKIRDKEGKGQVVRSQTVPNGK